MKIIISSENNLKFNSKIKIAHLQKKKKINNKELYSDFL